MIKTGPKIKLRQFDWCLLSSTTVPLSHNYIGKVEEYAHGEKNVYIRFFDSNLNGI